MILKIILLIYLLLFNISCKKDVEKNRLKIFFKISSTIFYNQKIVFTPIILLNLNESMIKIKMYDKKEMRYIIKFQRDEENINRFLLYTRVKYKNRNSDVLFSLELNKVEKATLYTKRGDTIMIVVKIEKLYYAKKPLNNYNTFDRELILKNQDK